MTVGSVPPLPYEAGPGSAPADCGPTRSAPVTSGTCAIEPPPDLAPFATDALLERLLALQRDRTRTTVGLTYDRIPFLRGFPTEDWLAFWPIFSYRFVGPVERMGARQNFEPIVARSTALVLPSSYAVIACTRGGHDPFPAPALEFDEWVKLDLQYIDGWSLGSDLRILVLTVPTVLRGTGA